LLLADFGIEEEYGVWPLYQPLNTIEARSSGQVHLKDPDVKGGSEGWVLYEVKVGDRLEQFKLNFADPQSPWDKNYLKSWSSDNGRLRVEVKSFNTRSHPLEGRVEVWTIPQAAAEANTTPCPQNTPSMIQPVIDNHNGIHAQFEIGFDYPGPGEKHPVHESIAIAAFTRSSIVFPKATTYNNLNHKQWEYFRGMIWNDDPSCLLFDKSFDDNRDWSSGAIWYGKFLHGSPSCMTQRSHFGDLQFLHSMGWHKGDKPYDTRNSILRWMGVMFKLACGNQGVSELDSLRDYFPDYFNASTDPSGGTTLRDLILATRPEYKDSKVSLRALGVCMHMIQDSYAMGHVQRRLTNPHDFVGRDAKGYINFRAGTWAQWGAIVSFHTYGEQDSKRHSFYDGLEGAGLPNPKDLQSFNRLHGARDAIEACIVLINAFAKKMPWEKLREKLEKTVYAIDPNAGDCDSAVDGIIPGLDTASIRYEKKGDVFDYEAGMLRKLSSLESGVSTNVERRWRWGMVLQWNMLISCFLLTVVLLGIKFFFIIGQ